MLSQGTNATDILLYEQHGSFFQHLSFFINITSLADSITCALCLQKFQNNMKSKLLKESMYPVFIFIFAFLTMLFFQGFVIPQLLLSFDTAQSDTSTMIMITIMRFITFAFIIILACIIALCLCMKFKKLPEFFYIRIRRFGITKAFVSYQLAGYCKEMERFGLSTRKIFSFLLQVKENYFFHACVNDIFLSIEQGIDFIEVLESQFDLNEMFCLCYRIGAKSNTLQQTLDDFIKLQEQQFIKQMKRFSMLIQSISYSFVAILVIFVYQIMLVPLQMLETM